MDREEAVKWNPVFLLGFVLGWAVNELRTGKLYGMYEDLRNWGRRMK